MLLAPGLESFLVPGRRIKVLGVTVYAMLLCSCDVRARVMFLLTMSVHARPSTGRGTYSFLQIVPSRRGRAKSSQTSSALRSRSIVRSALVFN